jgi:ABC-type Fe3+-siderophore transport system permease subunit
MSDDTYALAQGRAKGFALASLITSISATIFTLGTFSFIGAILGHVALSKLKSSGSTENRGFAIAGIIIGWVASIFTWLVIFSIIRAINGQTSVDGSWWNQITDQFQNA